MKAVHEEEIKQLTAELEEKEAEFTRKLKDMEEKHELEVKEYVDEIQKLKEGRKLDCTLKLLPDDKI